MTGAEEGNKIEGALRGDARKRMRELRAARRRRLRRDRRSFVCSFVRSLARSLALSVIGANSTSRNPSAGGHDNGTLLSFLLQCTVLCSRRPLALPAILAAASRPRATVTTGNAPKSRRRPNLQSIPMEQRCQRSCTRTRSPVRVRRLASPKITRF